MVKQRPNSMALHFDVEGRVNIRVEERNQGKMKKRDLWM